VLKETIYGLITIHNTGKIFLRFFGLSDRLAVKRRAFFVARQDYPDKAPQVLHSLNKTDGGRYFQLKLIRGSSRAI
jgi:hypothetical protein